MTKRDFFILFIKVIGLFLLLSNVFSAFPALVMYSNLYGEWETVLLSVSVALIIIGFFVLLVQHADKVVSWLNLTKGFDDDRIEFGNISKQHIIRLASMLLGGYLIVSSIPNLISALITAFYNDINYIPFTVPDKVNLALQAAYSVVGYLLITNAHLIEKWFLKKHAEDD